MAAGSSAGREKNASFKVSSSMFELFGLNLLARIYFPPGISFRSRFSGCKRTLSSGLHLEHSLLKQNLKSYVP